MFLNSKSRTQKFNRQFFLNLVDLAALVVLTYMALPLIDFAVRFLSKTYCMSLGDPTREILSQPPLLQVSQTARNTAFGAMQ